MMLLIQKYSDNNNKAYLEYANTPSKPRFAPSYVISGQRADEFVTKYNEQSKAHIKNSILMTISGLLIGWGAAISSGSKTLSILLKSFAGGVIGLLSGIAISKHEKNKLMDKYHVEEF